MKHRVGLLSLLACALTACSGGGEERRGPAAGDTPGADDQDTPRGGAPAQSLSLNEGTVPMKVKVVVGRVDYSEQGTGQCASSAESSIYDVPATQWHVTYGGVGSNIQHLNLTVWRPRAGGPDMVGPAFVVAKRVFAGSWEYLLDDAIFTAPPHPAWSGAALIDREGWSPLR